MFDRLNELLEELIKERSKAKSGVIHLRYNERPCIIVPDIHGRPDFVKKVLDNYFATHNIIFLGDILHREQQEAWNRIEKGIKFSEEAFKEAVIEELSDSLEALRLILEYEYSCYSVYSLRGNHDDVACRLIGDYGKYCFPMESALFREGLKLLAPETLKLLKEYEKTVPYLLIGPDFLCSHAIPNSRIVYEDIIRNNSESHSLFTWSDNTYHYSPHVYEHNMNSLSAGKAKYWFIGHRPVKEPKMFRTHKLPNGTVYQNNHPKRHVVIEKHLFGEPKGIEL